MHSYLLLSFSIQTAFLYQGMRIYFIVEFRRLHVRPNSKSAEERREYKEASICVFMRTSP